jgi:8-oxo-dGTP diphosphatase
MKFALIISEASMTKESTSQSLQRLQVVARVFVLNPQNAVLLVSHDPASFWYTPGGHVENGESLIDCALREVQEETALVVAIQRLVFVDELIDPGSHEHKLECYFLASTEALEIALNRVDVGGPVKQARFFSRSEIAGIAAVFPKILRDDFWTLVANGFNGYDIYRNFLE